MILLPWLGFGGFSFVDLLNELASFGFFAYILPLLLIFATVFAILSRIEIFKDNKGVNLIISLAIGFLALQFPQVPQFFAVIFSNLGIGIGIMLAALILAGVFITGENSFKWIFFGIGGLIFIIITFASLSSWNYIGGFQWGWWWANYGGLILFLFLLIGVIVAVLMSQRNGGTPAAGH